LLIFYLLGCCIEKINDKLHLKKKKNLLCYSADARIDYHALLHSAPFDCCCCTGKHLLALNEGNYESQQNLYVQKLDELK